MAASKTCGGTGHILPAERARSSFDVKHLIELINGGADNYARATEWKQAFKKDELFDQTYDVHDDRKDALLKSAERSFKAHKIVKANPDMMSTHMNGGFGIGGNVQSGSSAAGNHFGIFVGALQSQASPEQQKEWFSKAIHMKIMGGYAQTELGHGSNVRALETTATYDPSTEEFVIDSPTLTSAKWWPGCFGLLATHAIVYARLILNGKEHGIQSFMVQLRDENHKQLPGVEVGDIGPKIGYNLVDNGYCLFDNVRIPRKNMLARFNYVTKEGVLVKQKKVKTEGEKPKKGGEKLGYLVMIQTRVGMVYGAYNTLAKAATIAIRYSAIRHQGFKNTREDSLQSGEYPVLDYQVQQYRLFKWLAVSYAFFFSVTGLRRKLLNFYMKLNSEGDIDELPDLHASTAGLKAFCTNLTADGIEECRRCCGGHGSTMNSGIAQLVVDYNAIGPIAEGDKIILALQMARFLVRGAEAAAKGQSPPGDASYLGEKEKEQDINIEQNLRSLPALVSLFKSRARSSVLKVTASLARLTKSGVSFDEAWNRHAVALVKAAENHTFYLLLNNFAQGVEKVKDGALRGALERQALLFAHMQLSEKGADWAGKLNEQAVDAIQHTINALLSEIRPDAVALVDGFAFEDSVLHSSLGRYDGNVYESLFDYARKNPLNDPAYVHQLWEKTLKDNLDRDYIAKGKQEQRVGAIGSKL